MDVELNSCNKIIYRFIKLQCISHLSWEGKPRLRKQGETRDVEEQYHRLCRIRFVSHDEKENDR